MQTKHWITLIVVFLVGYFAGVWQPQYGQKLIGKG